MGLGRRTFAPGEVLTASNVMNYLQDQAVMSFAGTAARGSAIGTAVQEGMVSYLQDTNFLQVRDDNAWHSIAGVQAVANATVRDSLIPTPNQGDKVFRSDLGYEQTYYAAWGTANPGGRASAGWYDNQRNIGAVPIVPATVSVSGGGATANSLGTVSFTAATSIQLNSVFSNDYKFYRVVLEVKSSVGAELNCRFATSGTANTSANYQYQKLDVQTGTVSAATYSGTDTTFKAAYVPTTKVQKVIDLSNVFQTDTLAGFCQGGYGQTINNVVWNFGLTTEFDGIQFTPASGNITGSITIYGMNS